MPTLADRIIATSGMPRAQAEHLRSLCISWQVLADLSFSDLFLYVPVRDEEAFEIAAQIRPFTSQTLYPHDLVGNKVTQPEHPIVERAFREGEVWKQDMPVLVDGIQVRLEAVPVRYDDEVVGVVTKEGNPAISRRPGRLEEVYLKAADAVSNMISHGLFPSSRTPPGEWPRVGDGLFIVDTSGRVTWASPNALSSLRRLGIKQDIVGQHLDDLGLGRTPVQRALSSLHLHDGEIVSGGTHVAMRVIPLVENGVQRGALVLSRDVSEVREKERLLSVKDATIREIHHRVKNNLQTIASLLRLQSRRLRSEEAKEALEESVYRIASIALVHETLSEDPSDVAEFGEIARRIGSMVTEGLVSPEHEVSVEVRGEAGRIGADLATPLAVTVTELIQNAIEHAFPDRSMGKIVVDISRVDGEVIVEVNDDGVGISTAATEGGARLGLQIIRSLIEEMGGDLALSAADGGGTKAVVRVPVGGPTS